ncbi:MAG: Nudix family hydrolase [Wenzhouxiangellaceae bacterium]
MTTGRVGPAIAPNPNDAVTEVAAGLLRDRQGRVLLARRRRGTHLEGLWEFPGGKIEVGETAEQALARELEEELGIRTGRVRPWVSIRHDYDDRAIRLILFEVFDWVGEPVGRERQPLMWADPATMEQLPMPAADRPLRTLLDLDGYYAISRSPAELGERAFLRRWASCLEAGYRLIRLRPAPGERVPTALIDRIARLTTDAGARWIASGELTECFGWPADGLHLSVRQLVYLDRRPIPPDKLLIASCHDLEEIRIAAGIGADLVTLSPVCATSSHPDLPAMGWTDFARLVRYAPLPVLALGGVGPGDWARARAAGAFGVAGIRAFGWAAP